MPPVEKVSLWKRRLLLWSSRGQKRVLTTSCPLAKLVYHRMCLTQIEIFRFIRFHFVCDEISASQSCVLRSTAPLSLSKSDHDTPFSESMAKRLHDGFFRGRDDGGSSAAFGQVNPKRADCRIEAVEYKGWHAQQISNQWVQLIIVPQNGGRLMQVTFAGHPYLFVNPKLAGKYLPPSSSQWFNYGGDKLWLLPEGNNDEQHWVGNSDVLDDGPFTFRKLSEGQQCEVELTGPSDPQTGIQFTRTIRLDADSPRIRFHASMKNTTGHTLGMVHAVGFAIRYVSFGRAEPGTRSGEMNHDFWTFTPANRTSSYLNRYHVRFGPAENPAVSVRDDGLLRSTTFTWLPNYGSIRRKAGWRSSTAKTSTPWSSAFNMTSISPTRARLRDFLDKWTGGQAEE